MSTYCCPNPPATPGLPNADAILFEAARLDARLFAILVMFIMVFESIAVYFFTHFLTLQVLSTVYN